MTNRAPKLPLYFAIATTLVAMVACTLNPQPIPPSPDGPGGDVGFRPGPPENEATSGSSGQSPVTSDAGGPPPADRDAGDGGDSGTIDSGISDAGDGGG